ncbi:MAG: ATP-binding protein [Muribaculaceae bacterium]
MLIFILASGVAIFSQNNPYKISDRLYPDFLRLQRVSSLQQCQQLTDSLYAEAVKINDTKAQVAILCTPLKFAQQIKDSKVLDRQADRIRAEALKYNYPQYYFHASKEQATYYINKGNFAVAVEHIKNMEHDANTLFNGYGQYLCYQLYGNYYRVLHNETEAIKYYEMALELAKRNHPDQDHELIYTNLSISYRYLDNYDKALEMLDEGLANLKDRNLLLREYRLLDTKCFTLYMARRNDEAERIYDTIHSPRFKKLINPKRMIYNDIYHYSHIGDFDKALKIALSIEDEHVRYAWMSKVEMLRGNDSLALVHENKAYEMLQRHYSSQRESDFARANADLGNHILQVKNAELKLRSNELELHNSRLALEKQRSIIEMERIASEKNRLELDNKELSIQHLSAVVKERESERKLHSAEINRIQTANRIRTTYVLVIFVVSLIIILGLIAYLLLRRRSMRLLTQKNNELTLALHRAEESERTKMRFLQNMSHEIRTPLNAIIGFSQMLAHQQESDNLSDLQKQEFIDLIDENTETLTTLIDDILLLSAMENGAAMKIKLTPCVVNSVCRKALASVKHRCPNSVKLYYTTEVTDEFSIVCDSQRLQQVLVNFLTNAEKHTQSGEILLHASLNENPGKVTFSVTDTGEGVPVEMAESIFNRFEKLDTFVQGAGLGLNICRMIAVRLNAIVKLDTSHPGPGARFVFIVPLKQPDENQ